MHIEEIGSPVRMYVQQATFDVVVMTLENLCTVYLVEYVYSSE